MITKGNDTKVQNEVIAQTITDETAKRLKLARLFPKQEIKENSDYYTYFRQNINLDEAIKKGLLGEAKDIAPGASLQELNIRKPVTDTISIDTVGGVLNVIGGNLRIGQSDYFVAEACEYTNTFLSLSPTDAIILNIEEDHLDFFKDLEEIRESFSNYIALVPEHGTVYINGEIKDYNTVCKKAI